MARGDRPGLLDPDIGTRRVAAPRWDDDPAWHEAVGVYVDIAATLCPETRLAVLILPSEPAGRDIGTGLQLLGRGYIRRLEAIRAAVRGEHAPAAAHEVAGLARRLWAPESPTKTLATLRRPKPSPYVAAVDAAIAEGAPLVPVPEPRAAKCGRESPLDRYLRECAQNDGVIDGH